MVKHIDNNGNITTNSYIPVSGGCFKTPHYHVHIDSCYKACGGSLSSLHQVTLANGDVWTVWTCNVCSEMYNLNTPSTAKCSRKRVR